MPGNDIKVKASQQITPYEAAHAFFQRYGFAQQLVNVTQSQKFITFFIQIVWNFSVV